MALSSSSYSLPAAPAPEAAYTAGYLPADTLSARQWARTGLWLALGALGIAMLISPDGWRHPRRFALHYAFTLA